MEFLRKFVFDGFVPGDFTFGAVHIGSIVFTIVSITISIIVLRRKEETVVKRVTKILAGITLFVYLVRHVVNGYTSGDYLYAMWPFYICNINTVFMCIWILFDIKFMKDFFIITGMYGAVLTFVVPDGIFTDQYLNLGILDSVLSHYTIVYIPLILLSTRVYELDIKRSWQVMLGYAIVVFNVEVVQGWLFDKNTDYLFLRGTLPFTIEGVPQFLIVAVFAIGVSYIIYFINYLACGKLEQLKEDLNLS